MSARSRILGWSVLLLAVAMGASAAATHVLLVKGMNAQVKAELRHEIGEFRALAARRGATPGPRTGWVLSVLKARTSRAVLEQGTVLVGMIGTRVVATSGNVPPGDGSTAALRARWAGARQQLTGSAALAGGPARYTAIPVRIPGDAARGTFVAAVLTGPEQARISRMGQLQLEVGGIALLLGSALAWLMAGRVLRPVRATTDLARRITDTDLSGRIPVRGRGEVGELGSTFNRMLDRLEAALTTQRRFLADAGHELRTPLTIIQGNLDTLQPATPDDAETLSIAAEELARMSRLVDELALLASSERPDFLRTAPTGLDAFTRSLLAKARRLDDRPWRLAGTTAVGAVLDPQRITQAMMQLAANAAAHTPPGTAVEIGSAIAGDRVEFTVSDHGPGIPAAERSRVFQRFARLDARRTGGIGLGLSIVAAIAAAHGGAVKVRDRAGGGAAFCLCIPYLPAGPSAGPGDAGAGDCRDPAITEAFT